MNLIITILFIVAVVFCIIGFKVKKNGDSPKKHFIIAAVFFVLSLVVAALSPSKPEDEVTVADNSSNKEEISTAPSETTSISESSEVTENVSTEERVIRTRIAEKYADTDIDSITLNDDLGTEAEGDYIALVRLTWNVKNSGKTSKEMLSMYSSDLAATVAQECPTIQEIAIFWTVPHLNDTAKCSYERKDDGMYEMDMVWGKAFE